MEPINLPDYNCIDLSIGNTDFHVLFPPNFHSFEEDWNVWEHYHLFCECHFLKSGDVRLVTAEEEITFNSGTFCVIPKKLRHKIETVTEPTRKISFYVTISKNKHSENHTYTWYEQMFSSGKPFIFDKISDTFLMLYELTKNTSSLDFMQETKLKHVFSLAFLELLQQVEELTVFGQPNLSVDYDNELTLRVEKFLINNFLPNAQLDDLAQYLCLSQRQTHRLLKRLINKSFQEIKNETRITKAKDLIHKKEHSLKEIAEILGYSSYIGFYKSFRQATGVTPEEYRDSVS